MIPPDPNLERSWANPDNTQDVIPPTERGQDPAVGDALHELTGEGARPLSADERKAADRDTPPGERVYAPASERVPVEPVPGHRNFTDHTDTHTPEREAAGERPEPSFTRVSRPSQDPGGQRPYGGASAQSSFGTYDDAAWNSAARSSRLPLGLALAVLGVGAAIGAWLFVRWQRERNKPINRLRRQARQTAAEIRDRVPSSPEEAVRPAGLTTALLSILAILWQQAQSRSQQREQAVSRHGKKAAKRAGRAVDKATEAVSDVDWQKRLTTLKKRWDPSRLELEKVSVSRR